MNHGNPVMEKSLGVCRHPRSCSPPSIGTHVERRHHPKITEPFGPGGGTWPGRNVDSCIPYFPMLCEINYSGEKVFG